MIKFTTTLKKFGTQGEKTGWTYFELPQEMAEKIKPDYKKSFRVKGKLDELKIKGVATVPMGGGNFIIAVNFEMRKQLKKSAGAPLKVQIDLDKEEIEINKDFIECLNDEPKALAYFNKLPPSHQKYYSRWIESAKTDATKAIRIAQAVNAMAKGLNYGEMIRKKN